MPRKVDGDGCLGAITQTRACAESHAERRKRKRERERESLAYAGNGPYRHILRKWYLNGGSLSGRVCHEHGIKMVLK